MSVFNGSDAPNSLQITRAEKSQLMCCLAPPPLSHLKHVFKTQTKSTNNDLLAAMNLQMRVN